MARKIDINAAQAVVGSRYPAPHDAIVKERVRRRLGDMAGLTQFGVNLTRLPPGCWSSQRHWHVREDEFVYILEGEVVLVTNSGEETFRAGDCAGFKAGAADGHHLQNRSRHDVVLLEVGSRFPAGDGVEYPDIDLRVREGTDAFVHRDGSPYVGG
jgi:uncharacterized cupin superfamily protein